MTTGLIAPRRDVIAYHEAGHAVVGHVMGLRFSRIYVGSASGQIIFDEEWSEDAVLEDPALLDCYALMLLAATAAEWRHTGTVLGATGDIAALSWLIRSAKARGTLPMADRWRRANAEAARHWPAIEALADELAHRGTPVADQSALLLSHPHLGTPVEEVTGVRVRELLRPRPGTP